MKRMILAVLMGVLALGVAEGQTQPGTAPGTSTAPASGVKLAGLTFVSVDKHEVGRGVGGPAMGNWRLRFAEKTVSWRYSDVSETFRYTVAADGKINVEKSAIGGAHSGQYDAESKEVTWDGVKYKQE